MQLPTNAQISRQQQWEDERYRNPARQRNDWEPADSIGKLLRRDDQEAGD
jgi:hypothetical protein